MQEKPWPQCSSCHESRFAPKPCISIISLVSREKTQTKQQAISLFSSFPPLPSVHPEGFMLYFSAGSEPWFQKGESTILVTPEIVLSAHLTQPHAVHGHFPWGPVPSPSPPFCPCTSQFMFQENRGKGAALATKTGSCLMLWYCYLWPEEIT